MNNLHLFELINAPPGLGPLPLGLAVLLARWVIYLIPLVIAFAWVRGDRSARHDLLLIVLAAVLALGFAQIVAHAWPQPRPFALHLGVQYLAHANDAGLPSDHVTVFWSVALAALASQKFALWSLPTLALGLVVGWSRVYLGVHFPFDIAAALPVALAGTAAALVLRAPMRPVFERVLALYDRLANSLHARLHPSREP
jgi:undecaprenyl-diphosphatase